MKVSYLDQVRKQVKKLDNSVKFRILDYFAAVAMLSNPCSRGKQFNV